MNWFVCNYMKCVVNVLHMLLMLSSSVSTTLPNIRQIFLWTLLYQSSHSSRTKPWVLFMLPYLVCWDIHIPIGCSTRRFACPSCCVFLPELGLIPFNLELTFTFPPFEVLEPLILIPWLTASVTLLLLTQLSYLPLWDIAVNPLPYDPLLGLLNQMIWVLIGTSY